MQTSYGCIFHKKKSVAAINITLGIPGRRADAVAEIYKAFWAFLGISSPDRSGFKNKSYFFGVARSTYVGSPFRNTSRVGSGVEIKKTAIFVLIRAEIGPTENGSC